jgi:hypothetical protein
MDRLKEIFEKQQEFTRLFFRRKHDLDLDRISKDKELQIEWNKEYILSLITEATEILNEIDWKMHTKKDSETINDNILEECIDVMKYLFGLIIINGFSVDDMYTKFIEKTEVVYAKFKQEELVDKMKKNKDSKIVFVDIDGVLADYPNEFIKFVNKKLDKKYKTMPELKRSLEKIEFYKVKSEYRLSGIKKEMGVLNRAKDMLKKLKEKKYFVVLLTARPYKEYFRIYSDTLEWLKSNELYFDAILWDQEKEKYIMQHFNSDNVKFCIDDDIDNINKLYENGFKSFLIKNELMFNNKDEMDSVIENKLNNNIDSFDDLDCFINFFEFMGNKI